MPAPMVKAGPATTVLVAAWHQWVRTGVALAAALTPRRQLRHPALHQLNSNYHLPQCMRRMSGPHEWTMYSVLAPPWTSLEEVSQANHGTTVDWTV